MRSPHRPVFHSLVNEPFQPVIWRCRIAAPVKNGIRPVKPRHYHLKNVLVPRCQLVTVAVRKAQPLHLVRTPAAVCPENEAVPAEKPYRAAAFYPAHQLFPEHLPHRVNNVSRHTALSVSHQRHSPHAVSRQYPVWNAVIIEIGFPRPHRPHRNVPPLRLVGGYPHNFRLLRSQKQFLHRTHHSPQISSSAPQ